MDPKLNPKSKSERGANRKSPLTLLYIVGMLESSAHLDTRGSERRQVEAKEGGKSTGQDMVLQGKPYKVVELPSNSYSIGITLSAQVLAGQAAELALKYAYECEHGDKAAPQIHWLDDLFSLLSDEMKKAIEEDYSIRKQRHSSSPWPGWETAEEVFRSARDYPVRSRYATEEGQPDWRFQPIFLREAVCSVLASLGYNIRWHDAV